MAVNVGIIGLGWAGRQHAKVLAGLPDAVVTAGADLDASQAKGFAETYDARVYSDMREMLDKEDELDAVIVGTDAGTRLEPVRAVCEHGLALFCEKPPALDLATAIETRDVIERAGILNTVGFQSRWMPTVDRMRELLAGRTRLFARIVIAWPLFDWVKEGHATDRLYRKSACGGPMIEQGIHYQDVLRYVTGDEPIHLHAMAELGPTEPVEGRDCEDTTIVTARHQSGMLSTHVQNWSCKDVLHHIQIVGVEFDLTWRMSEGNRLIGRVDGEEIDESSDTDPYVEEIRGFVAAVAARDQNLLRSPYADACKTLAVCQAAAHSVATGHPQDVDQT